MSRPRVVLCVAMLCVAFTSSAATFTVTTSSDSAGPGTIRQAILAATASPGMDEIRFAVAEIWVSAPLVITGPVHIEGMVEPGQRVRINTTNSEVALRFGVGSSNSTVRNTFFGVDLEIDTGVSGVTLAANHFSKSVRINGNHNLVGGTAAGEGNLFDGAFRYSYGREVADLTISGHDNEIYGNTLEYVRITFGQGNRVGRPEHGNLFHPEVLDYGLPMSHCRCTGGTALYLDSAPTVVEGNTFELYKACGYYPYPDVCGFTTPIRVVQSSPLAAGSQIRGNILTSAGTCAVSIEAPVSGVELLKNPVINGEICLSGGANHSQQAPSLLDAQWVHGVLRVTGTLTSAPDTAHIVELYRNDGVQNEWLDSIGVVTTSAGLATFTRDIPLNSGMRKVWSVTATATNAVTRDTSSFAGAIPLIVHDTIPTLSTWSLLVLALGLTALVLVRLR